MELADELTQALAPTLGSVVVSDLRRLTAGASRETWSFEATGEGEDTSLIVQLDRPHGAAGACAREGQLVRLARTFGAPVADVLAIGELDADPDRTFTITRRIDGETIPRRILRDDRWVGARASFVADAADALALIHSVPVDDVPDDVAPLATDPIAWLRAIYDPLDDPHPALELGMRWLERNKRPQAEPVLVHGDFRLGNLLLDDNGLSAVLDWELAHIGDPAEDLGWLCVRAWRFGEPGRVAGIADDSELLQTYNARTGRSIDLETLRWWELYGTIRWGVICLQMGGAFRTGSSDSLELAMVGRRVVETEADVIIVLRELEAA